MTDQQDAPLCPHGHGPMTLIHQNDSDDLPLYVCEHAENNTACPAVGTPALIAQEYKRGRQDERERLAAVMREADNHHNALLCPYCNPDGIDPQAERQRAEAAEARVRELERAIDQELEARDKAQDALLEASGAMGGPEWSSRIPEPDPPDSGDLHRDVPELARQIVAERDRLRETLQESLREAAFNVPYTTGLAKATLTEIMRLSQKALASTCSRCGNPLADCQCYGSKAMAEDIKQARQSMRGWSLTKQDTMLKEANNILSGSKATVEDMGDSLAQPMPTRYVENKTTAGADKRDTCADCGTALKVSPPSPVTGGAWHHYCPNEACPSKAPKHGHCTNCGAPLHHIVAAKAHWSRRACKKAPHSTISGIAP